MSGTTFRMMVVAVILLAIYAYGVKMGGGVTMEEKYMDTHKPHKLRYFGGKTNSDRN